MIKDVELNVKHKGGGNFTKLPPVFSENGQYIFVASNNVVYSYHTKTGKKFHEYKGMDGKLVGFGTCTIKATEYLAACSEKGMVMIWKISSAVKLKQNKIPLEKVKTFQIVERHSTNRNVIQGFISWKHKKHILFGYLDLETLNWEKLKFSVEYKKPYLLDVGGPYGEQYLALIQGENFYFIHFNSTKKLIMRKIKNKTFTCIACHPEFECILTGDSLGRVLLWQNLSQNNLNSTVYHWHTLPVKTVCFSSSGSSFYSGGSECVVVKWDVENPQQRKFLARLPADVQHLAVANENVYFSVATADNGVHVYDMNFALISTVQQLMLGDRFPAGVLYDQRTNSLVINGVPGHLQFFSPFNNQLLYNLDVVGMNKLTRERDTHIDNVDVTHVAINRTGLWMAVIEERDTQNEVYFETRLKFWNFNSEKQIFQLNTSVEYPHDGKVLGVQFQTSSKELGLKCVTIGHDTLFKIWELVDATSVYNKGVSWQCITKGFYRDLLPTSLAFSCDGSLLAVGFQEILTTWTPNSCELKCSLVHPLYKEKITKVAFGSGSQCHLLVSASKNRLSVWNLLTLSMQWTVELGVSHLVSDFMLSHMAVFTRNRKLFVFNPYSPDPIYSHEGIVDESKTVIAACFIPNSFASDRTTKWYQRGDLFFIDSNKELYCLDCHKENEEWTHIIYEDTNKSLFSQLMPQIKSNALSVVKPISHNYTNSVVEKKINEFLQNPIHTMPPVRFVCTSILSSMILENGNLKNEENFSTHGVGRKEVIEAENDERIEDFENLSRISKESTSWVASVF